MNEASELRSDIHELKADNTRLRGEENYLKAKLEATELRLRDADLQVGELKKALSHFVDGNRGHALRKDRGFESKGLCQYHLSIGLAHVWPCPVAEAQRLVTEESNEGYPMKCECGEEIESIAHLKGHRQYCVKPLVPTKGEVQQLRDDLAAANLQLSEAKKALAQYVNVFLPGSICPANDLFQPGGMFHEPPKPWTQEQKEALAKVCDAFTEKPINAICWCASKAQASDAVCPVHG